MNSKSLAGKIAVITGASKGLGRGMAEALARAGAELALVSRDRALLEQTAELARAFQASCRVFESDVTNEDQTRDLAERLRRAYGGVDILINNAGINIRKPLAEFSLEEWNRVLNTNLTGAFLMCRALIPLMRGRASGRIINVTSMMSHVALPGRTAYCASKAGLLGLTRALALELAPEGITVNGISPGPIATEMNRPILENPELNQQFVSRLPVGRWGKVNEIAGLVRYLCSEEAGFITGTDIVIDGGWTAQ